MTALPRAWSVRILWSRGWYDGPLDGLAEWKGEELWFELDGDIGDLYRARTRPYVLRRLTPSELAEVRDDWRLSDELFALQRTHWAKPDPGRSPLPVATAEEIAAAEARLYTAHPWVDHPFRDRPAVATFVR